MIATSNNESKNSKKEVPMEQIINLIEGEFGAGEASEILKDLINHKIAFHTLRNASWEERYGKPNPHSLTRITELTRQRDQLVALLEAAGRNGSMLRLHSTIHVKVEGK